jgi:iron complex outermembrane receptor protein
MRPLVVATLLAQAVVAGSGFAQTPQSSSPAARSQAETDDTSTLPLVVVIGEKIDRNLKDTPTAVTVFQTPKVDNGQSHDIVELQQEVPNTTRNAAGNINIRGVDGNGPVTGGVALMTGSRARVSSTVDGINETWAGQQYLNVGLWDVEQVEVLRGPQSTIQGRNAIAGAVVTRTKDPTFDWEGAVRVGAEDQNGRGYLAAAISGPLVEDQLAFRLAVDGMKGKGFIKYDGTYPFDPSALQNGTVRAKLLWKLGANLQAKLTLQHRTYKGEYLNRVEALCTTASCANTDDMVKDDKFSSLTSYTRRQDSRSSNANVDLDYRFTDALTGYLVFSHGQDKLHFDQTDQWRFAMDQEQQSNTLEGRVVYAPANARVSGVAGVYYFHRDQDLWAGDTNPVYATIKGSDRIKTLAGYGEARIGLAESFGLLVGARIERETQQRNMIAFGSPLDTDVGETMFLPKLGLQYKLPTTTFALTARQGYNPGAGSLDWSDNTYYEYQKEEVLTYELTSRSVWLDNRVSFNATLFYNDYEGYQAFTGRRVINIDKAVSSGLELEVAAQVMPSLNLYGSIGLLGTEVKNGGAGATSYEGNHLNSAPDLTANLGFRHKIIGKWFWSGNVSYTGDYYTGIDNNPSEKAGDYFLANLQAGYDARRYSVRAYVKNVFDQKIMYSKEVTTERWPGTRAAMVADVGAPRTVGVVLDYNF